MMVDFGSCADFAKWAGGATAVDKIVPDVGDAAYAGPKDSAEPFMLGFRKGTRAVRLAAVKVADGGRHVVTMAQMREIADLMIGRMD